MLAINLKSSIALLASGNIIYLRLRVTAGARHHQEGAGIQKLQIRCIKALQLALALLEKKSYASTESLLDRRLSRKDYLQINAFPDLVVVEREGNPHALQRKATGGATSEVVRKTSTSASTPPSLCSGDGRR